MCGLVLVRAHVVALRGPAHGARAEAECLLRPKSWASVSVSPISPLSAERSGNQFDADARRERRRRAVIAEASASKPCLSRAAGLKTRRGDQLGLMLRHAAGMPAPS